MLSNEYLVVNVFTHCWRVGWPWVATPVIVTELFRSTCRYSVLDPLRLHQAALGLYSLPSVAVPEDAVSIEFKTVPISIPRDDLQPVEREEKVSVREKV